MKKLGLGLLGLIIAGTVYYTMAGSAQIANEIKKQVDTKLVTLQQEGFGIENREAKENKEHFVIHFNDPEKIAHYMTAQGIQINPEDAKTLYGMKIGIDIHYLPDAHSALSLEIYPLSLPPSITSDILDKNDKKALAEMQNLLDKKTFLVHVDFDKLLSSFKGYMKDIHEMLEAGKEVRLNMEGMHFEGNIEKELIKTAAQELKLLSLQVTDDFKMNLSNLKSSYDLNGSSQYDTFTKYEIEQIQFSEKSGFSILLNHLSGDSTSWAKNELLSSRIKTKAENIIIDADGKKTKFHELVYDATISNLNIPALEKLSQTDANNQDEINTQFEQMLSGGATLDISALGVSKIEINDKTMDGFTLNAKVSLDNRVDLQAWQINPLAAQEVINAQTNIVISSELFAHLMQEPEAMIIPMLFPPKEENGKKIYDIELKKGVLKINDTLLK